MRQDQRWNNSQYYRPSKLKQTVSGKARWIGKKTAMTRVVGGTRYYADARASKQQLALAGTTDANIRGYSITIPVEKTRKYQEYLDKYQVYIEKLKKYHARLATHRGMAGDLNINQTRGMPVEPREPTKPLKLRYYAVYARKGHQFGPRMPRM